LIGLVAMIDPPHPKSPTRSNGRTAPGIRVHVVTGDNGLTTSEIARQVGIGAAGSRISPVTSSID
jgi:P-type E1-E2 ATPase